MVSEPTTERIESVVDANRITIAVVFPVVGAIVLLASAEGFLVEPLAFNPLLIAFGVLVMRTPVIVGAIPLIDRRAISFGIVLVAFTYAIEIIGVRTGVPYGHFEYGVDLGVLVAGVPVLLAVLFVPLAVNAYLLALVVAPSITAGRIGRIALSILALISIDMILDPGAVALGFWTYAEGGLYYGVPVSNYLGWLLSATVAIVLIDMAVDVREVRSRLRTCAFFLDDFLSFLLLWGAINLYFGHLVPVVLTICLGITLGVSERYSLPASIRLTESVRVGRSGD